MSLGEKIQQLRKTRGLSQEQLADHLNVSRQAISKWETDQSSPDVEKILAISAVFSISTDELLGNNSTSNHVETSVIPVKEGQKRRFRAVYLFRYLTDFINNKILFMVFTLSCFIAIGVCVIVNVAINQQITWAAYPMLSVLFGWFVVSPLIFRKYVLSLCSLMITVIPYLFFIEKITPAPGWFLKLGLPLAIIGIIFLGFVYILIRFVKISMWYKAAIFFFLAGALVNPIINYFVDRFLETEPSFMRDIINIFSYFVVAALFWILGHVRNKSKSADNKE